MGVYEFDVVQLRCRWGWVRARISLHLHGGGSGTVTDDDEDDDSAAARRPLLPPALTRFLCCCCCCCSCRRCCAWRCATRRRRRNSCGRVAWGLPGSVTSTCCVVCCQRVIPWVGRFDYGCVHVIEKTHRRALTAMASLAPADEAADASWRSWYTTP